MKRGKTHTEPTESEVCDKLMFQLQKNINFMQHEYEKFASSKKLPKQIGKMKDCIEFYMNWMVQYCKYEDGEKFRGSKKNFKLSFPQKADNVCQFFNSLDPHQSMNLRWRFRFDSQVINTVKSSSSKLSIISVVLKLALGHFASVKLHRLGPMSLMASFFATLSSKSILVFCILPERYPVVECGSVVSYVYGQYIRFLGIVKQESQMDGLINKYMKKIAKHPDLFECFEAGEHANLLLSEANNPNSIKAHDRGVGTVVNFVKIPNSSGLLYSPKVEDTKAKLDRADSEQIVLDPVTQLWTRVDKTKDGGYKIDYMERALTRESNTKALREIASAASCKWLVSFFEKIPNFRLKLTEEEKTLIGEAGNILAIGRSGTGKTTCALLRLFATEMLFKVRSAYANRAILKDTRFSVEDVDANCGLHTVFITASPVLTNEVRRYYEKLNDKIKQELAKREEKRELTKKQKESGGAEIVNKSELAEEKKEEANPMVRMEEIKEIEEGLEMLDEGEAEKQMTLAHTLNKVKDEQFPLFLTVRRLMLMIDGTLKKPFFARNEEGQIIGLEGNTEWHNENRGVLMINSTYKYEGNDASVKSATEAEDPSKLLDELERTEENEDYGEEFDEEERQAELEKRRESKKQTVKKNYMAKEVDFETFSKKFWPSIQGKIQTMTHTQTQKVNAASVWREIQTNIKGSVESHEYAAHHIPIYRYREIASKTSSFKVEASEKIFEIFYQYERWTYANNYYDMSDLVNHVLSQVRWNGYHGKPIHFIMCDEVQDLTPATLLLLLKLTEQNLFFSGDTAQTIAQGVSFRFGDLKGLFYDANLPSGMPSIMQLTVNFRSHARILDLANSVIRSLEIFFPESIDKLKKERSPNDGIMPVVLDSEMQESLFNLLSQSSSSAPGAEGGIMARPPLEFGCDQVIIVRNQQAKANLPRFLKHALCLTIYEAKGLEFDDVILYNFFTDSEVKDEWRLLKALLVESVKVPKDFSEGPYKQSFDHLTAQPWLFPEEYKALKEGEYDLIKNVRSEVRSNTIEGRYTALMSELKHLYTAITRPRKRLIIFDENPAVRKPILEYWLSLGYVKVITQEQFVSLSSATAEIDPTSKQLIESLTGKNTSKTGWRAQGIRMFRRKYYEQAMKCFEHSGDTALRLRAEAYYEASRGSELTAELETLRYSLEVETNTKEEKKHMVDKMAERAKSIQDAFGTAAKMFDSMALNMQAGQCYFSVQNYPRAAECFEKAGLHGQAGEAYFKMEQYIKAGELYEQGKVPSNAIIAYEKAKDWERVLQCIHNFGHMFSYDHKMKLIKRYIQLALQAAFEEYEAAQEEAAASKLDKGAIRQLESSEVMSAAEDKKEVETKKGAEEDNKSVSESSASNPFEDVNVSKSSEGNQFEVLEKSGADSASQKALVIDEDDKKSDFSLVDTSSVASKKVVDMDHIASLDPDDEWIKCETGSVIDSVVSGKLTASNKVSDYSMLDNAHAFVISCSLVKTKRDIFVEDQTMTKVIRYVSYFSEDVQRYLDTMRSKSVLLHTKKVEETPAKEKTAADFIVDMDEIDLPFVNLLLDVLETLGLYKLCIIICNRYQINSRLGRYIVAISQKYSNIKLLCDASEKYVGENKGTYREMQAKNSIIANAAIHSVLEVVNPAYLKLKKYMEMVDETNSLGTYCYKSMLLLGYWKKLVYIMDCEGSLSLTSTFADYYNYKMLYAINFGNLTKENAMEVQHKAKGCNFDWLKFKHPTNMIEKKALILALDSVVWELNKVHRFTYAHPVTAESPTAPRKALPEFLAAFPCNEAFWKYVYNPKEETESVLAKVLNTAVTDFMRFDRKMGKEKVELENNPEVEIRLWDFCVALMQLLYGSQTNLKVEDFFVHMDSDVYNTLLQCVHKLIDLMRSGKTGKVFCELYYTAYLATLSAFGIRKMEGRDCSIGYGKGFVLHRNSYYFDAASQLTIARRKEKIKALEEKIAKQMPQQLKKLNRLEFEETMKERLRDAMEAEHNSLDSAFDMYFADLDTEYILASPDLLTDKICEHIARNVGSITVTRIADRELKAKKRASMRLVWEIDSAERLRNEIRKVALKIGEISYTLRVVGMFVPKALEVFQTRRSKISPADYYFNMNKQKEQEDAMKKMSKKQKKKAGTLQSIELMTDTLHSQFFVLQNLATMLFSAGSHTHINAEEWVLDSIQGVICGLLMQVPESTEQQIFPALCSYLAIDKYILFVEQLRGLQRTSLKWVPETQTTWLDALAEYKTHCVDDCYLHLLQFYGDNRKELNLYSQLAVVEKIVTLSIIMRKSLKGFPTASALIPTNMLKHMEFTEVEGKVCDYKISVFKHEASTETEDAEIKDGCKQAVKKLIEEVAQCYHQEKKKMLLEAVQVMVLALFLNARDRKEIIELAVLVKMIVQEGALRLSMLSSTFPDDWTKHQETYRMQPNVLLAAGIHEAEWPFKFWVANVELMHDEKMAPNAEQLEKDCQNESRLMATHLCIFKTLRSRKPDKEMLKAHKKPFSAEKYEITREARAFGHSFLPSQAEKFWENKTSGNTYQLVECVKDTHMMVLNTFYKTPIFNVLDAHYLFTHLDHINEYYVKAIHILGCAIEAGGEDKKGGSIAKDIRDEMEKLRTELKTWKNNKFMPDEEYIEKKKIVYRIKWQQHKRKEHQQKVSKRAGQKRQDALMKKASAIKGKERDLLGIFIQMSA